MQSGDLIRVLGPIDVVIDGGALTIEGRNARRLLGALVIGAGRSVSSDRLEWTLWGDAPPPSAGAEAGTEAGAEAEAQDEAEEEEIERFREFLDDISPEDFDAPEH